MDLYIVFVSFLFGTVVGSFLDVVITRYGKSSLGGRSRCPSCGKELSWFELVPIFSYIFLRGKCSKCKSKIPLECLLVELGTGLVFASIAFVSLPIISLADFVEVFYFMVLFCVLIIIFVYDLKNKIIPDTFSYTFAIIALTGQFINFGTLSALTPNLLDFLAGPILFVPFYLLWKVSNGRWIGLGDGKLSLGIGWMLGFSGGLSAILIGFWIGALVGVILILTSKLFDKHKRFTMKSEIPFGPFLIIGLSVVFFFDLSFIPFA